MKYITILLASVLASCAFVPAVDEQHRYAQECDMYTRQLELKIEQYDQFWNCQGGNLNECLLGVVIGLPAITFVVSGSVILIGNTLHWFEYEGTCEGGMVAEYVCLFKNSFVDDAITVPPPGDEVDEI